MKVWILLLLAAGAAAVYFVTRGKPGASAPVQGNNSRFTSTGTAGAPGFFGLGAFPSLAPVIFKPGSNAAAWASVGERSVNALAKLADTYYRPNTKVQTQGAARADSPSDGANGQVFQSRGYDSSDPDYASTYATPWGPAETPDIPVYQQPDFEEQVI